MDLCTHSGCKNLVSKAGHKLCLEHWKLSHPSKASEPELSNVSALPASKEFVSATTLGERLGISNQKTNQVLAELGWMKKDPKEKGWIATPQGLALGALQKHHSTGTPFVVWPDGIENNKSLVLTVKDLKGDVEVEVLQNHEEPKDAQGFRDKFPATHRTTDGHWVRSKAEMLIDNWLYMSGIVHAYERKLPIDEELYCDFYIPDGKVYVEYWGLESDPKYQSRKKVKLDLYRKYNYNLIELSDEHIKNLDDVLPKMLLKFDVAVS